MKIAYVGYDLTCLKTAPFFKNAGHEVCYFVKEKGQLFPYQPFAQTDVYFENVMIPHEHEQRTVIQKALFEFIESDYKLLENALGSSFYKGGISSDDQVVAKNIPVFNLTTLLDVKFDSKKKKVYLELEKEGSEPFDFILTESHPLLSSYYDQKQIELFKSKMSPEYIWSSVSFEIDFLKPISPFDKDKMFFMVMDGSRRSLVDNWFLCHFKGSTLIVWSFQPANQIHNPEFQNFYIDRVRQYMAMKLHFIQIKNYRETFLSTVGPENDEARLQLPHSMTVPNFTFWSSEQIHNFFVSRLDKKLKKIKKQIEVQL